MKSVATKPDRGKQTIAALLRKHGPLSRGPKGALLQTKPAHRSVTGLVDTRRGSTRHFQLPGTRAKAVPEPPLRRRRRIRPHLHPPQRPHHEVTRHLGLAQIIIDNHFIPPTENLP